MATTIHESGYRQGSRAVVPEGNGQKFRVRLMGWEPGAKVVEGSSADYPVSVIARDFAEAFPAGTRMRANHDGFCEAGGDVRRIMAKTISAPEREADGMYADAIAKEGEPSDFLRQFADVVGTSISAGAEVEMEAALDDDGDPILDRENKPILVPKLSERGAQIVKRFLSMSESPYNACDFVEAPGADGAVVKLALESAKNILEHTMLRESVGFAIDLAGKREKNSEAVPSRSNRKGNSMDEAERKALVGEITESVVKAIKPTESDKGEPKLGDLYETLHEAGLSKAGRKGVFERVERGESIADAITAEKQREDDIKAEFGVKEGEREERQPSTAGFGYTSGEGRGFSKGTEGKTSKFVPESLDLEEMAVN
jgi:hypothetical protein